MNRVEIKPTFYCTHPEAKQDQGCPARKHMKQLGHPLRCVTVGYDGNSQTCNYFEAEAPEPEHKPSLAERNKQLDAESKRLREDLQSFNKETI